MSSSLDTILSVVATVCGSIAIFLVQDWIRNRRQRRTLIAAVKTEIEANLAVARRLNAGYETVFELSHFENNAYRNGLVAGAMAALSKQSFELLSRAYDMMAMHDKQTLVIQSEWVPRDRGYRERITLIESLLTKISEDTASW